jgi:formate dehydrogenase maturation protein FdhE
MIEAIPILSSALETLKKLKESTDNIKNADLNMTIAELASALVDVKMRVVELQEENIQLKKRADFRENMEYRDNVFYLNNPPKGYHAGPYCPKCLEDTDKIASLRLRTDRDGTRYGYCNVCKDDFYLSP